jgi:hypothetical protein
LTDFLAAAPAEKDQGMNNEVEQLKKIDAEKTAEIQRLKNLLHIRFKRITREEAIGSAK